MWIAQSTTRLTVVGAGQHRARQLALIIAASVTLVLGAVPSASATGVDSPEVAGVRNVVLAPLPVAGAQTGTPAPARPGVAICATAPSAAANVNTDCDPNEPHNETAIAVNPTNPDNIIGGTNDVQLIRTKGGAVIETMLSRARVTFDGGRSWATYPLESNSAYSVTGDPSLAFDDAGRAYYATLGFRFTSSGYESPDVVVSTSSDGGRTWTTHRVATGSGVSVSVHDLLDKEYVTAWGDGNAIVSFGDFRFGPDFTFGGGATARIYTTVTHDGGATWTTPTPISGSLPWSYASVPVRTADGHLLVGFLTRHTLFGDASDPVLSHFEVVPVDPVSGAALGDPVEIAPVYDAICDFGDGLSYQDSLFRSGLSASIAADPTDPRHLAAVWDDMRNTAGIPFTPCDLDTFSALPDPYAVATNSDVIVAQSFDGGHTWTPPQALARPGDQFMPWSTYDIHGLLRIGTFDRSYDPANHAYGYTLATETAPGALTFTTHQVTTALSDPTRDNRWYASTVNPDFPKATRFIGDYSTIAPTPDGGVVVYWTDLRDDVTFAGTTGKGQNAYFARVPD